MLQMALLWLGKQAVYYSLSRAKFKQTDQQLESGTANRASW